MEKWLKVMDPGSCPAADTLVFLQHQNFEEQMQGMKTQLVQLSSLLRMLDLTFWNYLGT